MLKPTPIPPELTAAIAAVPAGRWAVGVSGGADSVALLTLLATHRPDCRVVVAHLDHQLRGEESDGDAAFVEQLGREFGVPAVIARREAWERKPRGNPAMVSGLACEAVCLCPQKDRLASEAANPAPAHFFRNPSARYRAARLAFFADVVRRHECLGVLLAHHVDDQAETVLLRLLRGAGLTGLGGITSVARVNGLLIRRPLLGVPKVMLREYLLQSAMFSRELARASFVGDGASKLAAKRAMNGPTEPWREDSSNASPKYARNVVRRVLADDPALTPLLLTLAAASQRLRQTLTQAAPPLGDSFAVAELRRPPVIAEHLARQWLVARGAPADRVSPAVVRRLIAQALDPSQASRQHYPGKLLVRRRQKRVDVIGPAPVQSPQSHGQKTDPTPEF